MTVLFSDSVDATVSHGALNIDGMPAEDRETAARLLGVLASKRAINKTRQNVYEAAQITKHMGIAVPPHMREFETTLTWGEGACTHLNDRIRLGGFAVPDSAELPLDLARVIRQNKLLAEAPMAHLEALKYGPSFTLALAGYAGEPDAVIRSLSARVTTGDWNANARRLTSLLTITGARWGRATEFILATDQNVYTVAEGLRGLEVVAVAGVAMCPGSLLPFRPDLDNPFGRSRLSHPVMRAIDRAQRTLLRSEITAEFFSAPQRYLLGADESIFEDEDGNPVATWDALIGRVNTVSRDEQGNLPSVSYAPQISMQPHMEMSRHDAAIFASLVSLPPSVLGVVMDNPDSAEAMEVRWDALDKIAQSAETTMGSGWVDTLNRAVMVRDGLDDLPEELDGLAPKWPTRKRAAMAAAMAQEIAAMPWVADTEDALRGFGHGPEEIERMLADKRRSQGASQLDAILAATRAAAPAAPDAAADADTAPADTSALDDAAVLKAKFDALGVAVRAGVKPEYAAKMLGLEGIQLTGAVPTSLKMPGEPGETGE
jgi:hypothetical protein